MTMLRTIARLSLPLALGLAACGESAEPEGSDDFASRIGTGEGGSTQVEEKPYGALPAGMPGPAANGRQAMGFGNTYSQPGRGDAVNSLKVNQDGTFELVENGRSYAGNYQWLSDGKRIRLQGVPERPIVLVADNALYRLSNEDVPLDDLTPDRMYARGTGEQLPAN